MKQFHNVSIAGWEIDNFRERGSAVTPERAPTVCDFQFALVLTQELSMNVVADLQGQMRLGVGMTLPAKRPTPSKKRKHFLVYAIMLSVVLLVVSFHPVNNLDAWSHWGLSSIFVTAVSASVLLFTLYFDPRRERTFREEIAPGRKALLFIPYVFLLLILTCLGAVVTLGIFPLSFTVGTLTYVSCRNIVLHVFFVLVGVALYSGTLLIIWRRIDKDITWKTHLWRVLCYVSVPGLVGFAVLFGYLLALAPDTIAGSNAFANGAIAFQLLAHNLSYAIVSYQDEEPFRLSTNPNSLLLDPGTSGTVVVTVQSVGDFDSPVSLSLPILPSGVFGGFSHSEVTPRPGRSTSSTLSITVASNARATTTLIAVHGIGGGFTATQMVALVTPQPQPEAS